jgi:ribosomal protein L7/L12
MFWKKEEKPEGFTWSVFLFENRLTIKVVTPYQEYEMGLGLKDAEKLVEEISVLMPLLRKRVEEKAALKGDE